MVSIIVPIYNVENYLKACLDSILGQTYQDFELILVDDGSPDDCGVICDSYATLDKRVKVIHKENGGVSDARNVGMKEATGEYVLFIDGDDRIHPQMVEVLITSIESGDYDLSMVDMQKLPDGATLEEKHFNIDEIESSELSSYSFFCCVCSLQNGYPSCFNKLYRRSLIERMEFSNMIQSEDLEWNIRISLRMQKAIVKKAQMYYYIQRKGSAMHGGLIEKAAERIWTYKVCLDAIPEDKRAYRDRMLKLMYSMMLYCRRKFLDSANKGEIDAACDQIYQETIQEFLDSNNSRISKMRSILGYHCPRLYNFILNKIEARTKQ